MNQSYKHIACKFIVILLAVLLLSAANLLWGSVSLDPESVIGSLIYPDSADETVRFITLNIRIPQIVTALFAGAGLAATGLMMQTVFRNPLAGPSILGISSGASLGVAIVTLFFGGGLILGGQSWTGEAAILTGAFAGSLLVLGLLLLLAGRIRNDLMLLITGIMLGYLTSSAVTLLTAFSSANALQSYAYWGMGTFSSVSLQELPIFSSLCIVCLILSLFLTKPLNLLLLGDLYAANLGVNISRTRTLILLSSGTLTALITAYCGPIAFIGLAMPHIARMIFRTDNHGVLLPAAMIIGGGVCLLCNVLSTTITDTLIPVNALTPLIGVPVILRVLLVRGGSGA